MTERKTNTSFIPRLIGAGLLVLIWLIINIRVEAGVASPLERTIDGLVAGALLLIVIFEAVSFFGFTDGSKK